MAIATYAAALDAVRGIAWPALRRVRTTPSGPHASIIRGSTAEFVEYRPYRQGDDPRRIDWKLVARADRVYVRVSQERTILPTVFVIDASASMAFPTATLAKWDLARQLTIALAAIARHRGDPVGLIVAHASGTRVVAPRTRSTVVEEMFTALDVAPGGSTSLSDAAREAFRLGSRVVLLSDFLGEDDGALFRPAGAFTAAGGELYAVHVVDPLELDPDPRQRLVEDPERPEVKRPLPPSARAEYIRRFTAWRDDLARSWRRAGAVYELVVPGTAPLRRFARRITGTGGKQGGTA